MNFKFKDCFARFNGDRLVLGNTKIEREILFEKQMPLSAFVSAAEMFAHAFS